MAKVIVNDSNLSTIAEAIRTKVGGSTKYKPSQMASAIMSISTGGTDTEDATLSSGAQLLNGVTAYAKGSKYTGSILPYAGQVDGSQGSISGYEIYSGSYYIEPLKSVQTISTANKILTNQLQIGAYPDASISDVLFTSNGSYSASDFDVDGFGNVVVNVPQVTQPVILSDITISSAGSYSAADNGADGFGNVTVVIPTYMLSSAEFVSNGTYSASDYDTDGFNEVTVNVSNTYTSEDAGKVVSDGELISQQAVLLTSNGVFDTTLFNEATVSVASGGVLVSASISENGTYYPAAYEADGFSEIIVSVEGIVPTGSISISVNGSYDVGAFASAVVDVPNTYSAADEGKVLSGGELFTQGSMQISSNSTYDTTMFSEVVVDVPQSGIIPTGSVSILSNGEYDVGIFASAVVSVPNTYSVADEGKVVSLNQLVSQSQLEVFSNSVYNTTAFSEVVVSVPIPTGSINISSNGTYDVTSFANAVVSVNGNLKPLYVNSDGIYYASDYNCYGFSAVVVSYYISTNTMVKLLESNCSQLIDGTGSISNVTKKAFEEFKALTVVDLPSCTIIDEDAFRSCPNLTTLSLPMCESIAGGAFKKCSALTAIDLPNCVTVWNGAFDSCIALETVNLPNATNIGTFSGCYNLSNVSCPKATNVNAMAFYRCSSLREISLPACRGIGSSAFSYCILLSKVYLGSSSCTLEYGKDAFANTPIAQNDSALGKIYVPSSLYASYRADTYWASYRNCFISY